MAPSNNTRTDGNGRIARVSLAAVLWWSFPNTRPRTSRHAICWVLARHRFNTVVVAAGRARRRRTSTETLIP
eukprot:6443368-Alexandrium_andersonii.AAC.1